ncbi:hypothetical protein DFAR_1450020 [Desulfarculales bacterium]
MPTNRPAQIQNIVPAAGTIFQTSHSVEGPGSNAPVDSSHDAEWGIVEINFGWRGPGVHRVVNSRTGR